MGTQCTTPTRSVETLSTGPPVCTHDKDAAGVKAALAEARRERLPEYRNAANQLLKNFLSKQG